MVSNTKTTFMLCAAFCAIGIGANPLDAFQNSCCPGIDGTTQAIVNLVNTQSGAGEYSQSGDTVWTYSLNLADPCTLNLTEHKQTLKKENSDGSATPVREITHYLIPAADLEFGAFSTHRTLEQGYMRVIMWTRRATIRRWRGDSSTPPHDAAVIFNAAINFGKPNVDIFQVPLLFENALMRLSDFCRAQ